MPSKTSKEFDPCSLRTPMIGPSLKKLEWREFTRLIATPDNWARIQEYRKLPSLWK